MPGDTVFLQVPPTVTGRVIWHMNMQPHCLFCGCHALYVTTNADNINTLRPRQDGRHFPDDIFKCIFLNENARILL